MRCDIEALPAERSARGEAMSSSACVRVVRKQTVAPADHNQPLSDKDNLGLDALRDSNSRGSAHKSI
jgi:hypothetical protein